MASSGKTLRRLTPRLVREALRSPAASTSARVRRAELGPLLAYAISDAPGGTESWGDAFASQLDGLPLLRLADERQRHESVPDSSIGPEGIAVLRTALGSPGGGTLWLCHKPDNQDYPRLLGRLATVYPVDTTDAGFLAAVEEVVAKTFCNVKVISRCPSVRNACVTINPSALPSAHSSWLRDRLDASSLCCLMASSTRCHASRCRVLRTLPLLFPPRGSRAPCSHRSFCLAAPATDTPAAALRNGPPTAAARPRYASGSAASGRRCIHRLCHRNKRLASLFKLDLTVVSQEGCCSRW